jgi:hypothetical protein
MMKKTNAIWPITGYAMNHRPACASAISDSRSEPASITGMSADMMNGRSYEMIWFTARITDSSAYLLFEPQPAMKSPTISSDETARKNRTPVSRSATPMPGANGIVAKISRHGIRKTTGARLNTGRSAESGVTSSFSSSFTPSAMGCSSPRGPTRYGPIRDCSRAANFRSSSVT